MFHLNLNYLSSVNLKLRKSIICNKKICFRLRRHMIVRYEQWCGRTTRAGWSQEIDHAGYVKYWQSNMNNVKMFQAHKEAIRGLRYTIHHTSPYVSCATVINDPSILAVAKILDMTLILFLFWFYNSSPMTIVILVWVHR